MKMKIAYSVAREIAECSAKEAPREACGLLAGTETEIKMALPLRNISSSPDQHFQLDPAEQLKALKAIDKANLQWIGVYHSHPISPPIPSETDIRQSVDPALLHLIVSLERGKPQLKLWRIEQLSVSPVELGFDTEPTRDDDKPLSRRQQIAMLLVGLASLLIMLALSVSLLPPAPKITPLP